MAEEVEGEVVGGGVGEAVGKVVGKVIPGLEVKTRLDGGTDGVDKDGLRNDDVAFDTVEKLEELEEFPRKSGGTVSS